MTLPASFLTSKNPQCVLALHNLPLPSSTMPPRASNRRISNVLSAYEQTISKNNEAGVTSGMYLSTIASKRRSKLQTIPDGKPMVMMPRSRRGMGSRQGSNRSISPIQSKNKESGIDTPTGSLTSHGSDSPLFRGSFDTSNFRSPEDDADDSSFTAEDFEFDEIDWDGQGSVCSEPPKSSTNSPRRRVPRDRVRRRPSARGSAGTTSRSKEKPLGDSGENVEDVFKVTYKNDDDEASYCGSVQSSASLRSILKKDGKRRTQRRASLTPKDNEEADSPPRPPSRQTSLRKLPSAGSNHDDDDDCSVRSARSVMTTGGRSRGAPRRSFNNSRKIGEKPNTTFQDILAEARRKSEG